MNNKRRGLGLLCLHCGEPFAPSEYGVITYLVGADGARASIARHRECELRQVIGSVGHLTRKCSCYGGGQEDPLELSVRDAARAAVAIWEKGRLPAWDQSDGVWCEKHQEDASLCQCSDQEGWKLAMLSATQLCESWLSCLKCLTIPTS
jgi:hypothetical protein